MITPPTDRQRLMMIRDIAWVSICDDRSPEEFEKSLELIGKLTAFLGNNYATEIAEYNTPTAVDELRKQELAMWGPVP